MLIQDLGLLNYPPRHLKVPGPAEREARARMEAERIGLATALFATGRAVMLRAARVFRSVFSSRA